MEAVVADLQMQASASSYYGCLAWQPREWNLISICIDIYIYRKILTVVTMPLMCSSSLSRQTGQVGSSVCPIGGVAVVLLSVPLTNSKSLT